MKLSLVVSRQVMSRATYKRELIYTRHYLALCEAKYLIKIFMRSNCILKRRHMRFNFICLVLLTAHLVITLGLNSKFNPLLKENGITTIQTGNKKTR